MKLSAALRRRRATIFVMGALSLLALVFFGLLPSSKAPVTYGFTLDQEWVLIHQWVINAKHASLGFGLISLLASIIGYFQFKAGKTIRAVSGVVGF